MSSDEIEYLKRKKFIEYMNRILRRRLEEEKRRIDKGEDVYEKVRDIFTSDAFKYLTELRDRDRGLADNVLRTIIVLLMNGYLYAPVDRDKVYVIEKKLSGYKGRVYIEERGELKEFGKSIFRED